MSKCSAPGGTENQRSLGSCSSWNAVLNARLGAVWYSRVSERRGLQDDQNNFGPASSGAGPCCDLQPTVSFDGTNYLVTYLDQRNASSSYEASIYAGYATISAARVSTSGKLLDGSATMPGIVVTAAQDVVLGRVRSACINGAHWLVWDSGTPRTLVSGDLIFV